jgi:DNA-binding winged helix-turn-helix (wHTH) protein
MAPGQQSKLFRFGVYEADAATGELRKSGVRLRLQEQPFQVLLVLLERQGEVITREELRQQLWPADTFVDFDHSLNTIINKLREVLGDSASSPRFIETLARRGYRFLAPVEKVEASAARGAEAKENPAGPSYPAGPTDAETPSVSLLTRMEELPHVSRHYVRGLFFLIQVMYLCFYIAALARLSRVEDLLEQVFGRPGWITSTLVVTAIVGIPIRFYLLSGISFDLKDLSRRFQRLFVAILILDGLWALAPFLLAPQIGIGLALAATAALIYVPFAQRTLLLMSDRARIAS